MFSFSEYTVTKSFNLEQAQAFFGHLGGKLSSAGSTVVPVEFRVYVDDRWCDEESFKCTVPLKDGAALEIEYHFSMGGSYGENLSHGIMYSVKGKFEANHQVFTSDSCNMTQWVLANEISAATAVADLIVAELAKHALI
jgi:hypothetical protein